MKKEQPHAFSGSSQKNLGRERKEEERILKLRIISSVFHVGDLSSVLLYLFEWPEGTH
jgi:hypothetical protein